MRCPKCSSIEIKVLDTRTGKNETSIRRRRECLNCGYRFTTIEEVLRADLQVVKRDGRREDFDRAKMLGGLKKAVEKRPIDVMQIEMMIADVLASLEKEFDHEIPAHAIGEQIMLRLKHLDQIAYVRYASVYKDFRDLAELAKEINELKASTEMPKLKTAPVDQLRVLNELLGRVSDPHKAEHARRALEFAYNEHPKDLERVSLGDYVDKLAQLHFGELGESADFAFAHWHVPRLEDFSPLWIRQAIVVEMKKLAGRREGLLLVTGLRGAVCPLGKYWTKHREAQYERVRSWIDQLACAWATCGSRLQVVVL